MSISFSTVWSNLLDFVKNPRLDFLPASFMESPLKVLGYLLAVDFLLMIPLTMVMGVTGVEDMDHKVIELLDNPLYLALMAVILAPVIEEFIFRLPIGILWNRYFKVIFWGFTIAFALIHLSNFGTSVPIYLIPILVLPQFILGIILGYIRVGWGFVYAVLFHALHNGILVGLATLGQQLNPEMGIWIWFN